ncbi:MAG: flagellar basal body L-ring protein FlgH [Armatimonadota bacterium]
MLTKASLFTITLLISLFGTPLPATSLWTEQAASPYTDTKAARVGDVLTVIITEASSSSTQATHSTQKDLKVGAGPGTGLLKFFPELKLDATRKTSGQGTASNNTSFDDCITVIVREILPNGCLRIEGSRLIKLESDETDLTFGGIVRPEDIRPDNTVLSNYIADQQLIARRKGPIGEKQRPGLLSRLLSWMW